MTYFAFSGFDYKHMFYINRLYSLNLITLEIHRRTFKVPSIKSSIAQFNNLTAAQKKEVNFLCELFPDFRHVDYSHVGVGDTALLKK